MLTPDIRKTIIDRVQRSPCTVAEIAALIERNWRTADSYVEQLSKQTGTIATKTFRGGTRGALKIVYAVSSPASGGSDVQDRLLQRILLGRFKSDFSPFDIYQYCAPDKRNAFLEVQLEEYHKVEQDVVSMLRAAESSILIFSGNLTWAQVTQGTTRVPDVLREMAQRGVAIKILTKVDIPALRNVQAVLAINEELGRDAIEIRHFEQPLRAVLIDTRHARMKETKSPENYKAGELDAKTYIFYDIYDAAWNDWIQRAFYTMWRTAMPCQQRLDTLSSIANISRVSGVPRRRAQHS